jgi:lysine biosynthesis protein LysW
MSERANVKMTRCPECDGTIVFSAGRMKLGKVMECPECGVMLEVISLSPLELDYPLEDEDWDEDEDWEET